MKSKLLFFLAVVGILAGLTSAWFSRIEKKPLAPEFNPAPNPYERGIYANGIIESYQSNGANINIFPEVSGTITQIQAVEGAVVPAGTVLFQLDDTVQRAVCEQQKSQAEAALALLEELKAQPRKETLEVAKAQVEYASANLATARTQYEKLRKSYEFDPHSVSRDQLDNAENAAKAARANLEVAQKQLELTGAGAWVYEVRNQQHVYDAASKAAASAKALLDKYTVRAPVNGVVLAVNTAPGSYISSQGAYGTYTAAFNPVIVMGAAEPYYEVRCYIDEILIPKLPPASQLDSRMKARMFVRGTNISVPLEFVRIQPYVTPKIELSNQRTERVDVRVLPMVFRFRPPEGTNVYPGQLVDVYVEAK